MAIWRLGQKEERTAAAAETIEASWEDFSEWLRSLPENYAHLRSLGETGRLVDRWETGLELVRAWEECPSDDPDVQSAVRALADVFRHRMIRWAKQHNYQGSPDPFELIFDVEPSPS